LILSLGYFLLVGIYFALLQFSYFFLMSFNLSSSYLSYLAMVSSWVIGALVGLWLKNEKMERGLLLGSSLAYYVFLLVSFRLQFSNRLYFFFFVLVLISGVYSGYFFCRNSKRATKVKWLFFMENNGYILGMVSSFVLFTVLGVRFLYIAPLVLTACLWCLNRWLPAAVERSG
jgi:hypothetical protein